MNEEATKILRRTRILIGLVIFGIVISGVTAFPLVYEVDLLHAFTSARPLPQPIKDWVAKVHEGLHATDAAYPFLHYGTDWLAFGHIVIALFFIPPFMDPVRNVSVIRIGLVACVLVIPTALICGEIRGIPLWWRAIDCAFGVFGFLPLWYVGRLIRQLERTNGVAASAPALK